MKYIETLRKFSNKKIVVEVEVKEPADRKLLADKLIRKLGEKYKLKPEGRKE